ncbi:hypothetical protein P152DRAFT_218195 [Eremomyces bilateralis CBS 781.70]|uniref:Uncharacterized protein n=1 Tax=Eremomyces bilateralis CBS 781.70 TaxID=1392243 RepID=A0A6G1FS18_9PEZI|nr:uncharacterized protein P152DRAFT_218195 [Eremomyces bilateralis CBS 781.70]KAF1808469.1 hypothetical protein P152DRAFT_218195 [Eremomyces bilateralis CBS 781.70]
MILPRAHGHDSVSRLITYLELCMRFRRRWRTDPWTENRRGVLDGTSVIRDVGVSYVMTWSLLAVCFFYVFWGSGSCAVGSNAGGAVLHRDSILMVSFFPVQWAWLWLTMGIIHYPFNILRNDMLHSFHDSFLSMLKSR